MTRKRLNLMETELCNTLVLSSRNMLNITGIVQPSLNSIISFLSAHGPFLDTWKLFGTIIIVPNTLFKHILLTRTFLRPL